MFAIRFLDAVPGDTPQASTLLERLAQSVVRDGPAPVAGGAADEVLYPLNFAPYAGTAMRALLGYQAVEADLERLAGQQQADGGWTVTYASYSPAAALEWRGYMTVQAIAALQARTQWWRPPKRAGSRPA
ncbi:MAG: hypothetical protein ABIM89_07210, partial [Mycobacteriales bacterium]